MRLSLESLKTFPDSGTSWKNLMTHIICSENTFSAIQVYKARFFISECSDSWKTCSNDKGSSPISYDLTGRKRANNDSNFLQLHIHQASRNCLANFVRNESIKFSSLKFACNIKPRQSPQSQTAYLSKSHSYFQGEPECLKVTWHIFREQHKFTEIQETTIKV